MESIATDLPVQNRKVKLPDRIQIVKVASSEYKFVSLYGSTRVRVGVDTGHILDLLFPMLRQGCELEEILNGFEPSKHPIVLNTVNDLSAQGFLLSSSGLSNGSPDSREERAMYSEQAKFFSNFRAGSNDPMQLGQTEFVDTSSILQQRLKQGRVLLVGLGRVGSRLAKALAHVGVGHIYSSDLSEVTQRDIVDSSYRPVDVGRCREDVLATILSHINPLVEYTPLGVASLFAQDTQALPEKLDLLILCDDGYDPAHYSAINRLCLERRVTWTSCRNFGFKFEVGPLIVPHETACYECVELRKAGNLHSYEDFRLTQSLLNEQNLSLGSLNITLGYEMLALEVIKVLNNFSRPVTYGNIFSFNVVTF